MIQKIKVVLIFLFIFGKYSFVYAEDLGGNSYPAVAATKADLSFGSHRDFLAVPDSPRNLWDFVYGKPVKDGFAYLPFGMHTRSKNKKITNNGLLGVFYNSIGFGTFINSFDDRTWYLVSARNVITYNGFGLDYFAGAMYGYKGNLSTVRGIPFKNTFLFNGNLNPLFAISAYYEISEQFEIRTILTPLVVLAGTKYNF